MNPYQKRHQHLTPDKGLVWANLDDRRSDVGLAVAQPDRRVGWGELQVHVRTGGDIRRLIAGLAWLHRLGRQHSPLRRAGS
jgi:hypothetical protein